MTVNLGRSKSVLASANLTSSSRRLAGITALPHLVALVAVCVAGILTQAVAPALGQMINSSRQQSNTIVAIKVPPLLLCEPGAAARLQIELTPAAAIPPNSFLRIKGLPAAIVPSDGHQIGPGAWAVPIDGLAQLRLAVRPGTQGKSEISLSLVAIDGSVLAEARTVLVVAPAGLIAPAAEASIAPTLVKPPQRALPPAPAPPSISDADRAQAKRLHERALAQLGAGSIVAARALLERAVDLGDAEAAMVLAGTYDAIELARLGVRGVQADDATAKRWYARAQALGATGAVERIARLPK